MVYSPQYIVHQPEWVNHAYQNSVMTAGYNSEYRGNLELLRDFKI